MSGYSSPFRILETKYPLWYKFPNNARGNFLTTRKSKLVRQLYVEHEYEQPSPRVTAIQSMGTTLATNRRVSFFCRNLDTASESVARTAPLGRCLDFRLGLTCNQQDLLRYKSKYAGVQSLPLAGAVRYGSKRWTRTRFHRSLSYQVRLSARFVAALDFGFEFQTEGITLFRFGVQG